MAQAGGQARRPGPGCAVKPLQRTGSGNGAGAERSRPEQECAGAAQPGGRPEPQDETEHVAAVETLNRAVELCICLTPA